MLAINTAVKIIFDETGVFDPKSYIRRIDKNDIKKAFRDKVKKTHPDRALLLGRDVVDLEKDFKLVNEAYSVILKYFDDIVVSKDENIFVKQYCRDKAGAKRDFGKVRVPGDFFYTSPVPDRVLRFAEFLFYSGRISWNTLIKAIVWQYKMRPRLGEIAVSLNYIDKKSIYEVIRCMECNEKFGEAALRLRYIDDYKLLVLLGTQKRYDRPIGRYFVESGMACEHTLRGYLLENKQHNEKFRWY